MQLIETVVVGYCSVGGSSVCEIVGAVPAEAALDVAVVVIMVMVMVLKVAVVVVMAVAMEVAIIMVVWCYLL